MKNLDDLYSGYNDYNPIFDAEEWKNDEGLQQTLRKLSGRKPQMTVAKFPATATGARPLTCASGDEALRPKTGRPMTLQPMTAPPMTARSMTAPPKTGRPMTLQPMTAPPMAARPMTAPALTAVRAAGYRRSTPVSSSDTMGLIRGPAASPESENLNRLEEKIKILEKKVHELLKQSCVAQSKGDFQLALQKAKDAGIKERVLVRLQEQSGKADSIRSYLSFSVFLNLANQYANNEMYPEALNFYQFIMKNKMCSETSRVKVNMANIYVKQKNYPKAIKLFQMALDELSNNYKQMRRKIRQNIGVVFVRMNQNSDAITSFKHIMKESPNMKTGFNLILCYYAIGNKKRMKKAFEKLLSVPLGIDDEKKYIPSDEDPSSNMAIEEIKNDKLGQMESDLKAHAEKCIMTAVKLIAPIIESSFAAGFDWCLDMVKSSQYVELADDLELNKAVIYLKHRDTKQAKETLMRLVKKDSRVKSAAATDLSVLYFLEKDYDQADRFADLALNADRYNLAALSNKANAVFIRQEYEKAAEFYKEALRNDSSCTEALHNLGLTYKRLNRLDEALDCFLKLHAILRNSDQVTYQLANLYELLEDPQQAIQWYTQVLSVTPTDPHVLAKLGDLHDGEGDMAQAFQYYCESFRLFPCKTDVTMWLGMYYAKTQLFENAIQYFERAKLLEPTQVKWQLMVASCYRRSGFHQRALGLYENVHREFPHNVESLRFLVRLCADMGLKEEEEYATKLKKVEKMEQRKRSEQKDHAGGHGGSAEGSDGTSGPFPDPFHPDARINKLNMIKELLRDTSEPYRISTPKDLNVTYDDPLGSVTERPSFRANRRMLDDLFANAVLGKDMLP